MKFFKIKDHYINVLRKKDSCVLLNKNEKRPYIGIINKINGYDYFIPLSSMKYGKDNKPKKFH